MLVATYTLIFSWSITVIYVFFYYFKLIKENDVADICSTLVVSIVSELKIATGAQFRRWSRNMRRVRLLLLHYFLLLPVICPASGCSPRPGPAWTRTAARRRVAAVISEAERSFQRPSSSSEGLPCNHIQTRSDICKKTMRKCSARTWVSSGRLEASGGRERTAN